MAFMILGGATPAFALQPTIELDPLTATNAVGTNHTVTATVMEEGAPVEGADVHFAVSGEGTPSPSSEDAVTDADGEATFTFTNSAGVTNTITACVDEDGDGICDAEEPTATATKIWYVPEATSISLDPADDANAVGTDHTVTATVLDQFGEPLEGADVHFDVTGEGTPNPTDGDDITDAAGLATFTFTNPAAVTNTITACVDEDGDGICDAEETITDTATKEWQEPVADSISLAPETDTNAVGTDHTVTATVLDQFGEPFEGADVHFDVTGDPTPDPDAGDDVTDAAGEADFTFTNPDPGTNTITACVDADAGSDCDLEETITDTATKEWQEPVADSISLAPATDSNLVNTPHTVTATVTDQFGEPFQGAVALFAVNAVGAPSPTSGTAVTDAAGEADFTFTNSTANVTNTITACLDADPLNGACDVGEETATATKTWQAPPAPPPPPPAQKCPGFEGDARNQVVGTPGDDQLVGTAGADIICGLAGNDTLAGLGGNDLILGGSGHDTLRGGGGNDRLRGEGGRDNLRGGGGNDRLNGGPGRDELRGGGGNDRLNGGPGSDFCRGGGGVDVIRNCER